MKAKLVILDKNRCVFFYSGKSCSNLNSMTGTWQFLETNWQPVFMSENGSGPSNSGTSCKQSCCSRASKIIKVIIEKSRGGRFLLNRHWDFGWIWAGWHYWKKIGPIMSNFWGWFFSCFHGQKQLKFRNIVASALKSCIKHVLA